MKIRMMQFLLMLGLSTVHAAQTPIFQFEALTDTSIVLQDLIPTTVSYRVTNLLPQVQRLSWQAVPNIVQDTRDAMSCVSSYAVAPGASCVLDLLVSSRHLDATIAPEVCSSTSTGVTNPFFCSRSSFADRLVIHRPAAFMLSPQELELTASGSSAAITVTNLSLTLAAENIHADLSNTLLEGRVTQDASDCQSVAPGASCALSFTPKDEAVSQTSFPVLGDNTTVRAGAITISDASAATLRVTGTPLILTASATGHLTVTNESSSITASSIAAALPAALTDAGVTQDASACASVGPGASCLLAITAGKIGVNPTQVTVSGTNTSLAAAVIGVNAPPLQTIALTAGSPLTLTTEVRQGTMTVENTSGADIAEGVTAHFEGTALYGNVMASTCGVIPAGETCDITLTTETGFHDVTSTNFSIEGPTTYAVTGNLTLFKRYIYITNLNRSTVSKCTVAESDGSLSGCELTGSGFNKPFGVVAHNGYAYVTNNEGTPVLKCTISASDGALSACMETASVYDDFVRPRDIVIHQGYAYIANSSNNIVVKCDVSVSDGELSNCATTGGSSPGFADPLGLAMNNGYAYVTNQDDGRVSKCEVSASDGALSNCTTTATGFERPYDVVISNGYAYVSNFEDGNNTVSKCDVDASTGALSNCSSTGSGFDRPIGVAINNGVAYINNYPARTVSTCDISVVDGAWSNCVTAAMGFGGPAYNDVYSI